MGDEDFHRGSSFDVQFRRNGGDVIGRVSGWVVSLLALLWSQLSSSHRLVVGEVASIGRVGVGSRTEVGSRRAAGWVRRMVHHSWHTVSEVKFLHQIGKSFVVCRTRGTSNKTTFKNSHEEPLTWRVEPSSKCEICSSAVLRSHSSTTLLVALLDSSPPPPWVADLLGLQSTLLCVAAESSTCKVNWITELNQFRTNWDTTLGFIKQKRLFSYFIQTAKNQR